MKLAYRQLNTRVMKPCLFAASMFVLISCAGSGNPDAESIPASTSDSSSTQSFVPKNAEGYPEVKSFNKTADAYINQQLTALVDQWQCPAEGESQFNVERYSISQGYLSIQYAAMVLCSGMASPDSANDAITFSLNDGEVINLESLTQCESLEQVGRQAGADDIEARIAGCPAPQLSGDYFIYNDNISLLNFYPSHNDIGCEFEVDTKLSALMCQ